MTDESLSKKRESQSTEVRRIHKDIIMLKGKLGYCEFCKKGNCRLELANIRNHNYTKNPKDYKWLCCSCHRDLDNPDYCKKGHEFNGIDNRGKRTCSICRKKADNKWKQKKQKGEELSGGKGK